MFCDLVEPGSELWTSALRDLRHDFYHMPNYVRLCVSLYEGGKPRAFIARDDEGLFLVPLIVRPIEKQPTGTPLYDAISPYGYASPLVSVRPGCDEARFVERAVDALIERLAEEKIVSVLCRLHPLLPVPLSALERRGPVVEHGPTVYCDLRREPQETWYGTRETMRRQIRGALQYGFVAEEDPTFRYYDQFQEIYAATMRRVKATEWYFFDREHFLGIREALADTMHLMVVRLGEEVVCAGLFAETCGIVEYHLAGTRDGYEDRDVSKLLIHHAREWGHERGNDVLHLGGGVGAANDSLLHFKSGFSKLRGTFHTWRVIVDDNAYRALVSQMGDRTSNASQPTSYFPQYRSTAPRTARSGEKQAASTL
jgi:Acetyltransferase (GNAT) domain